MFWEAVEVACVANAQVVCLTITGSLAVRLGLIDSPKSKDLSKLAVVLLNPALKFSMFPAYSLERLARWSPVIALSLLHMAVGAALGSLIAWATRLGTPHKQCLIMCCALGNVVALPFMLVVPVVANWRAVRDDPNATLDAYGILCVARPVNAASC